MREPKNIETRFFEIGEQLPAYIIAEIGSNHNGNFNQAIELIEKARDAGVNAVKFQTFKAEHHYSKKSPKISMYDQDIYSLIESLEIDRSWHKKLSSYCDSLGIDFLDSPCDADAIEIARQLDMPILKVASFDMVDLRLIKQIAEVGKGVMFSTGMATLSEIESAVSMCKKSGNDKIIILQCTSIYPAPAYLSNLNAITTLKHAFGTITGYSDHTMGDHICLGAISMGAKVIEKHYTLSRQLPGPDHPFAIEPLELKEMVYKIRELESAFGNGLKSGPSEEEMEMYSKVRRSIVAARDIKKGTKISNEDLVVKRPGIGIHPGLIENVVGRYSNRDISADEPISWDML